MTNFQVGDFIELNVEVLPDGSVVARSIGSKDDGNENGDDSNSDTNANSNDDSNLNENSNSNDDSNSNSNSNDNDDDNSNSQKSSGHHGGGS
ncbi:MAG: hypothetical protein ACK40V_02265, partial [Anaerolineales bacterium]